MRAEGNDLLLDPARVLPPPAVELRLVDVRVEGDELVQIYDAGRNLPPLPPPHGDGGFMAMLDDGSMVVYGDYNIRVTRPGEGPADPAPIVIHYQSLDPIHSHSDGSIYFRCVLSSDAFEDFGGGLAQGVSAPHMLPDRRTVANIRNILTFPGLGFAATP